MIKPNLIRMNGKWTIDPYTIHCDNTLFKCAKRWCAYLNGTSTRNGALAWIDAILKGM